MELQARLDELSGPGAGAPGIRQDEQQREAEPAAQVSLAFAFTELTDADYKGVWQTSTRSS